MQTELIIFFVVVGIIGAAIAVIFSVDSISGKIFGDEDKRAK